ncbi:MULTISPECIES: hypothetical protein [unclassified Mesorhizobium]|uniref:hypothetical protein n=1 Tax=unclassified Mesorhizobium TaxID=325217 RepID=UPI0013DEE50E|nr:MULTISPECIES: hypothetical protein [unclassified Mesorhizobium]
MAGSQASTIAFADLFHPGGNDDRPTIRHGVTGVDTQVEQGKFDLTFIDHYMIERERKFRFYDRP